MKLSKISPIYILVLAIVFYIVGFVCMPAENVESLKMSEIAHQETYTYVDNDGEEHEGETLITINGLGKILTYKEVYSVVIPFSVLSGIIGMIVFNKSWGELSGIEMKFFLFSISVLGILLLWLTTRERVISTIMFWLGVISIYCCDNLSSWKN